MRIHSRRAAVLFLFCLWLIGTSCGGSGDNVSSDNGDNDADDDTAYGDDATDDDDDATDDDNDATDDDNDVTDDDNDATDDDTTDDDTTDDDACTPEILCERYVSECHGNQTMNECLEWYGVIDNCYDMSGLLECRCVCMARPTCFGFLRCDRQCLSSNCPDVPPLPDEPPIPGIPGQKEEMPPNVEIAVLENAGAMQINGGGLEVIVTFDPFSFQVAREDDATLLLATGSAQAGSGFAPIAVTEDNGFYWNTFYWGYRGFLHREKPWAHAQRVLRHYIQGDRVIFDVKDDGTRGRILFVVGPFQAGAGRLAAAVAPIRPTERINRIAFTFRAPNDERYVGFGERFNRIDQRGLKLETWLEEGGIEPGSLRPLLERLFPEITRGWALPSGEDGSYAPMPFFLSNYGYGLLADVPQASHFDLAHTYEDLWQIKVEAPELSLVVFAGPTPADALRQFTERTGRSRVPRPWMLAPWNMFVGYPDSYSGLLQIAETFRDLDIPSSVTHTWTDITPGGGYRGHEAQLIQDNLDLHELGYKVLCYLNARVDIDRLPDWWAEGDELGVFTKNADGTSYIQRVIVNPIGYIVYNISKIDFTHELSDQFWQGILQIPIDLGFDGFMYDFGEYTPPDSYFSDGYDGTYWHNPYPLIYQRAGYRFFNKYYGDPGGDLAPDYLYFHRSGYVGSQNWTYAMWSGDPEADWSYSDGLPAQVCAGINVGLSGIPFWGSDTGGFHALLVPAPTSELHKRWVQFSAFSGLMRDMTSNEFSNGHRIVVLDEEELTYIVRRYQKLRTQLVPYVMNAAWEYRETGLPLMRHPLLHYPEDPKVWKTEREFLFGPDLFIAPVLEENAVEKTFYLPPGRWIELWSASEYDGDISGGGTGGFRIGGTPIDGGQEITVSAPIDEIPIFVRWGAVIPLVDPSVDTWAPGPLESDPHVISFEQTAHKLHVWAFPSGDGSTILADGSVLTVNTDANGVRLVRLADPDRAELIAQVVWPSGIPVPDILDGSVFVPDGDPLTLPAGTWTWNTARNAAALHGRPGQTKFYIHTE